MEFFIGLGHINLEIMLELKLLRLKFANPKFYRLKALLYHEDNCPQFTIFIKLTDDKGKGLSRKIYCAFLNKAYRIGTNEDGLGVFRFSNVAEGTDTNLVISVPDMPDELETIRIYRPVVAEVKKRNSSAFYLVVFCLFLWVLGAIIGTGNPLGKAHNGLSEAERGANTTLIDNGEKPPMYKPVDKHGNWKHVYWTAVVLITLAAAIKIVYSVKQKGAPKSAILLSGPEPSAKANS